MLSIVKETEIETPQEIEKRYPHCKYLLRDFEDVNNMRGRLFAVSDGKDSFHDLCVLSDQLADEGVACIIMGEYEEGGMMIGVQREFKRQPDYCQV